MANCATDAVQGLERAGRVTEGAQTEQGPSPRRKLPVITVVDVTGVRRRTSPATINSLRMNFFTIGKFKPCRVTKTGSTQC